MMPPITNAYSKPNPYTSDAINANTNPITVKTFGDKPVAAKVLPTPCKTGFNESLEI